MDNFSPKASAEVNGVKVINNISFGSDSTKQWAKNNLGVRDAFPGNFIAITKRALNPAKYEENLAKARQARAMSVCQAYEQYKRTIPSLTDSQAFLLASGYHSTPSEADNVVEVLSDAAAMMDSDANPDALSDQFRDEFIQGSKQAYEDEVRELWTKLLNSELNKPGTFSKRTMGTLKEMSREDAEAFQAFCSCAVSQGDRNNPIPVITNIDSGAWSYNHGSLSVDQLSLITSLGLVETERCISFTIAERGDFVVVSATKLFHLKSKSDSPKTFHFGYAKFTPIGRELSLVCDLGNSPELPSLIEEIAKRNDMLYYSAPLSPLTSS